MPKHYQMGRGRSMPLHMLKTMHHTPFSHISGMGYAGAHKKDIGSMKSISGMGFAGAKKKISPLRFKI